MTNQSHTELAIEARNRAKLYRHETDDLSPSVTGELLERLAAALESPERVQGDDEFAAWLKTRAADSYSCGLLVKDALARLSATPSPQAERVPLSETQIWAMQCALPDGQWMHEEASAAFESGVRSAERHHGIVTKESST